MDQRERVGDPEEALLSALEGAQAKIWTALPGVVAAVDLNAQTVAVQPTIRGRVTGQDGRVQSVNMPLLADVPIVFPRAGGFALTFPIAVGDEVLVVFASRAIDSWWQSGGIGEPVEARMHDLSDAFAIPGPTSQPKKLSGVSAANVQLRNAAGDSFLEITPAGDVNIVSAGNVSVTAAGDATVTAAGSALVTAPTVDLAAATSITLTSPLINLDGVVGVSGGMTAGGGLDITGNVSATGTIDADLQITSLADVVGAGISLSTHIHSGVVPGGGNTGAPV